jgi:hypothetical protein
MSNTWRRGSWMFTEDGQLTESALAELANLYGVITDELRAELNAKYALMLKHSAGLHHRVASKTEFYQALQHLRPDQMLPILPHGPDPFTKPRGRPRGGYAEADAQLVEELRRRRCEGVEAVARELAPRAIGGGTLESKAQRLIRRLREK